jgi:hypothetical protein
MHVVGTLEKPDKPGAVCRINVATADVVRVLGSRARVAVVATFEGGYATRTSLMPRGGTHILPLNAEVCEAAGFRKGDRVDVVLREDIEPRTIEVPADLDTLLIEAGVHETFDAMSYSHRKEWSVAIADAKRPETRAKRIRECVAAMESRRS